MKIIDVVCGVLIQDEKCLIARRSTGDSIGKYEFPGGKVEAGETREEALVREFKEELQIDLDQLYYLDHSVDTQNEKEIRLTCFVCSSKEKPVKSTVHSNLIWTTPEHIYDYDFFEADRGLVQTLQKEWLWLKKQMKPKF